MKRYTAKVSFRWAVEEKNWRQKGLGQRQILAPLKGVWIYQNFSEADMDIDDIAVAFSDTLEKLFYDCSSCYQMPGLCH